MTPLTRRQMAWRVAQDIAEGQYVNLGIGLPTLVSDYVPGSREVVFHSENGILGMGGAPRPGEEDRDLINAGKGLTTLRPGGAFFHHNDSFLMIRGGHIDLSILGAMDLAAGAKEVRVLMEHNAKDGSPRLRKACSLPLTAARCVKRVYTNLAVLDVTADGFVVREMVEGLDLDALQRLTEAELALANDWRKLAPPAV